MFKRFLFHSKDKPQDLVAKILQRKDFECCFSDDWFDLFSGRRDKFRFQADGSVYLKVQKASVTRKLYLREKMVFKIKPDESGSEVKILLRPDLFWTYGLLLTFGLGTLYFLIVDPSVFRDFGFIALIILAYGWSGFSFYKQRLFFESYLKNSDSLGLQRIHW